MTAVASARSASAPPVRVLVIDDSAVVRGLVTRWLADAPDIEVVGKATNGEDGVAQARSLQPDVIVLDVEMPKMNGLQALPLLRDCAPNANIVMASTLTRDNADTTLKALAAGAADYLPKPESSHLAGATDYRRELVEKIRALGQRAQKGHLSPGRAAAAGARSAPVSLRQMSRLQPAVLAIGVSTGGPNALREFLPGLGARLSVPVLIVQHMPASFTAILAEHLDKVAKMPVVEGAHGMPVRPGTVYLAPGDRHMTVTGRPESPVIELNRHPPENYCRPAVDPLFRSVVDVYRERVLAVILTGMGQDGKLGCEKVVEAGGSVFAQDEESSVVWGMPGAVTRAGLAAKVAPLGALGPAVANVIQGNAR